MVRLLGSFAGSFLGLRHTITVWVDGGNVEGRAFKADAGGVVVGPIVRAHQIFLRKHRLLHSFSVAKNECN